jgi:hypothetical protein
MSFFCQKYKLISGLYLFQMGEYYSHWEMSIMHTIFKFKGDKNAPDNYRGIALAPILSKV